MLRYYSNGEGQLLHGDSDYNDNQWHHIAATYDHDSDLLTLYCDGGLAAYVHAGRIVSADSHDALIGVFNPNSGEGAFSGEMDETCVFLRALSVEEIGSVMADGPPLDGGYGPAGYVGASRSYGCVSDQNAQCGYS